MVKTSPVLYPIGETPEIPTAVIGPVAGGADAVFTITFKPVPCPPEVLSILPSTYPVPGVVIAKEVINPVPLLTVDRLFPGEVSGTRISYFGIRSGNTLITRTAI